MKFENPYFTENEKISLLQRWIIVQSEIYYNTSFTLVSDKAYDDNCKQLLGMIKESPKDFKESEYYYIFYDFDGTTGFHLNARLNPLDRYKIECIINSLRARYGVEKAKPKKKKNR